MGHVYQSELVNKDNYFIVEFLSIFMELLFMDYYANIDIDTSKIMKNNFISNLFFLLLNNLSQIELMKRFNNAFINMDLNEEYRIEFNSISLFPSNNKKQELYLQYYGIGLLLAINFYYKYKENHDFNEIKEFIIKNKDSNLNDLINNYVDISLVDRFINDYFNDDIKASK